MLFEGFILDEAKSIGLSANLSDHTNGQFCHKSHGFVPWSWIHAPLYNLYLQCSIFSSCELILTLSIDLSDYSCLFIEVYNIHTAEILLYPETIFYYKV